MDLFLNNRRTKLFLNKVLKNKKINYFNIDDLDKYLNQSEVVKIFGLGYELITKIKELNSKKLIHLGIRTKVITDHLLKSLSVIQFNNVEVYTTDDTSQYEYVWKSFSEGVLKSKEDYPEFKLIKLKDYKSEDLSIFDNTSSPLFIDYETKGFPTNTGFTALGVGIYSPEFHKTYYFAYQDDFENIKDFQFFKDYKEFIIKNAYRIYVYNCPFEIHVEYRQFAIFLEYQDVYPMVIMDGRQGSLKLNGQYYAKIKSWDDEIENFQSYFAQQFKSYKDGISFLSRYKDSKFYTGEYISETYLTKKDKAKDILEFGQSFPEILVKLSEYDPDWEDRVVKHWGNTWAVIPDEIMGYYCGIDCYVTYLVYKAITEKKYTQACYKVHLYNMYLKACANITGQINIHWDLKSKVENYYDRVNFNSNLFLTLMTFKYQKIYFKNLIGDDRIKSYNIHKGVLYIIYKYGSLFFLDKSRLNIYIKEFFRIVVKDGKLDINEMKTIFGEDWELYFPNLQKIVQADKLSKQIVISLVNTIDNLLRIEETSKLIIDDYFNLFKQQILNKNREIENYWWRGRGTKEDLIAYIKKGVFSNQKIPEEALIHIKQYYLDDPEVKYRKKNNFLPTAYLKHIFMYNVLGRLYQDLKSILANRIITSDIDQGLERFLFYNWRSTPLVLEYGKWLSSVFRNKLFHALVFFNFYMDNCPEGFVEQQSLWGDFENFSILLNSQNNDTESILRSNRYYDSYLGKYPTPWTLSNLYKSLTDKQLVDFCKCFEDKSPASITSEDKLVEPKFQFDDLFYLDFYDKIFRLYKFSWKELSASMNFINKNSFKIHKQFEDDSHIGYFTDEVNGTGYNHFVIPKYIPLSTKTGRFTANIHTIGGGDDAKLVMINDSPKHIASYFDVSQAEVRMLARMSGDPALQELYRKGGDAYKEMALMAYPYLAAKGREAELKVRRNEFKSIFLSYIYRALIATIAQNTGLSIETVTRIVLIIREKYAVTEKYAQEVLAYAQMNKKRKTFLGDTSYITDKENIQTTSVNHPIQSATTKLLGFGFYMVQKAARLNNIDLLFKYTVHDSNINVFQIKDLFILTMLYRKFFRGSIKNTFGVDFKYDLDLLPGNHRDHMSFKYNHSSGEFMLEGFSHHINKILNGLETDFEILKSEENDYSKKDPIKVFTSSKYGRDHDLFPVDKYFSGVKEKRVVCKLKQVEKYSFIGDDVELFNDFIDY